MTFTNQAAGEMRERLEGVLGGKRAADRLTIGTFHAICLELLGEVKLISPGEALTAAEEVLRTEGQKGSARRLLQAVSQVKNGLTWEEAGLDEGLYQAYCARLKELGVLDFDDLLTEALKRDVAGRRCFRHLLVDEFQDINDTQYALVNAWSRGGESLFVIGDPDQSIYGFRGASGACFQRLREDRPALREIRLVENYRSTPEVLQACGRDNRKESGAFPSPGTQPALWTGSAAGPGSGRFLRGGLDCQGDRADDRRHRHAGGSKAGTRAGGAGIF